ncbi:hypothetical protein DYB25_009632, partial [Aphanomyces astaci]
TDEAAARIKELMASRPDAIGIRLGVRTRGCSGLSYTMNYATEKQKLDEEVAEKGRTLHHAVDYMHGGRETEAM